MKAGLTNIRALARVLGNPQSRYPTIHIAGTNGKGSTSSMIASMLTASGYRTGLYTSPHLVDFTERIRVDGVPIDRQAINRIVSGIADEVMKLKATFFEATTAMAFRYFADRKVDVAVIETGLGGRLDATNIIVPLVSVITNIALDHTEHLGTTTSRIAFEKGGIIKPRVPCITGTTDPAALKALRRIARAKQSPFIRSSEAAKVEVAEGTLYGISADAIVNGHPYRRLALPLAGEHQVQNLQLALLAIDLLKESAGFDKITPDSVRKGLAGLRRLSGLHGRLEILKQNPLVIADVAHNPDGMRRSVATLREFLAGKFVTLFGVMADKEYGKMIDSLSSLTRLAVAVRPDIGRALPSGTICTEFRKRGIASIDGISVARGLSIALGELRRGEALLVTGSHYVAGEALNFLNRPT